MPTGRIWAPLCHFERSLGPMSDRTSGFCFFAQSAKVVIGIDPPHFCASGASKGRQSTILDAVMVLKNNESQKGSPRSGGCRLLGEKQTSTCFIFAALAALILCLIDGLIHAHDDFMADSVNAAEGSMAWVHVLMCDGWGLHKIS